MKQKKIIALHASHPSQVWLLKPLADAISDWADILWVMRDKDITVDLAKQLGLDFVTMSKAGTGVVGNALELFRNVFRSLSLTRRHRVDLWISKYGSVHIASRILGKPSILFSDDDVDVVPLLAWSSYPFASCSFIPDVVRMGRFEPYAVRFPSCFELLYLHPNRFKPNPAILSELGITAGETYAVVRLTSLQAHHDRGKQGVSHALLRHVVARCQEHKIKLFITSEKPLAEEFEPYRLQVSPTQIHHVLAFAEFLLGDSQTMTTEAAILGTPVFRINDFVGQLSAIDLLENYGLCHGFRPADADGVLPLLDEYLAVENRKDIYKKRLKRFLNERPDPLPLFLELLDATLAGSSREEMRKRISASPEQSSAA